MDFFASFLFGLIANLLFQVEFCIVDNMTLNCQPNLYNHNVSYGTEFVIIRQIFVSIFPDEYLLDQPPWISLSQIFHSLCSHQISYMLFT